MMQSSENEKRSYIMSKIKGKGTKLEELVRKHLFSRGFRYRKNDNRYPGKPDIVIPKYRTIVFVNGCFWHMHDNCVISHIPKNNQEYWIPKLLRNTKNDKKHIHELQNAGWKVIVVWECQLKKSRFEQTMDDLVKNITGELK